MIFVICLSRHGRSGHDRDAGHDAAAETDGHEEKTRLCRLPQETFDFLSYTFDGCVGQDGGPYWECRRRRNRCGGCASRLSRGVEPKVTGGSPRRGTGQASTACWLAVQLLPGGHDRAGPGERGPLRIPEAPQWWCRKYRNGTARDAPLLGRISVSADGVVCLRTSEPLLVSVGGILVRRADAGNRPSGSMSGRWKRSMVKYCDTRRRKGRANRNANLNLNHRAHLSTLQLQPTPRPRFPASIGAQSSQQSATVNTLQLCLAHQSPAL